MGSRKKSRKSFTDLASIIRSMRDDGTLEPGLGKALGKALKYLDHALKVGKPRTIRSAVGKVARLLVERLFRR